MRAVYYYLKFPGNILEISFLDLNSESRIMGLLFSDTGRDYRTMKNLPFLTSEKKKDWTANE